MPRPPSDIVGGSLSFPQRRAHCCLEMKIPSFLQQPCSQDAISKRTDAFSISPEGLYRSLQFHDSFFNPGNLSFGTRCFFTCPHGLKISFGLDVSLCLCRAAGRVNLPMPRRCRSSCLLPQVLRAHSICCQVASECVMLVSCICIPYGVP